MIDAYDVCVVGGGPGGYVAAIKAAQMGLKVKFMNMSTYEQTNSLFYQQLIFRYRFGKCFFRLFIY